MANYPYNAAAWAWLRKAHVAIEPLSRVARIGRIKAANTVDYIVAIKYGVADVVEPMWQLGRPTASCSA